MVQAFLTEYRHLAGAAEAVLGEAARTGASGGSLDRKGLAQLSHLTHVLRDAGLFLNFPQLAAVARALFELLRPRGEELTVEVKDGPMVHHQRPSVEVFFQSVAQCSGVKVAAALLTGMGSDGANGLLALRQKGAHTIAQDQAPSVVFGMPAEAIKLGGATEVAGLPRIAELLLRHACET
jgi:hypothetical protein